MMYDFDQKDLQEILEHVASIDKLINAPPRSTNVPTVEPQSTLKTNINLSNSKTLSNIDDKEDLYKQDKTIDPKNLKWNSIKGKFDDTSYSFDKAMENMKKRLNDSKEL